VWAAAAAVLMFVLVALIVWHCTYSDGVND
jgi:hypothetical protein